MRRAAGPAGASVLPLWIPHPDVAQGTFALCSEAPRSSPAASALSSLLLGGAPSTPRTPPVRPTRPQHHPRAMCSQQPLRSLHRSWHRFLHAPRTCGTCILPTCPTNPRHTPHVLRAPLACPARPRHAPRASALPTDAADARAPGGPCHSFREDLGLAQAGSGARGVAAVAGEASRSHKAHRLGSCRRHSPRWPALRAHIGRCALCLP